MTIIKQAVRYHTLPADFFNKEEIWNHGWKNWPLIITCCFWGISVVWIRHVTHIVWGLHHQLKKQRNSGNFDIGKKNRLPDISTRELSGSRFFQFPTSLAQTDNIYGQKVPVVLERFGPHFPQLRSEMRKCLFALPSSSQKTFSMTHIID